MKAKRILFSSIAALAAALPGAPWAQDAKPLELRMQSTAPPGTPWANGVQNMIKPSKPKAAAL